MIDRLIDIAQVLCEGYSDMPCGCEGCPIWSEDLIDENGEWECDLYKTINEVRENENNREGSNV